MSNRTRSDDEEDARAKIIIEEGPKCEEKYNRRSDEKAAPGDNSGQSSKNDEKTNKARSDRFNRILENYFTHLNLIFAHGSYSDYMDPDEIIKMAEIKNCIATSVDPRVTALGSLFAKVSDLIRKTWGYPNFAEWVRAIDKAINDLRNRNSFSALTCPTDSWSDRNSEGKLKSPTLNAIVAIRKLLEQRKFTLRHDIWKSYSVIMNEVGKEEYVSIPTDSILRGWRNSIYELSGTLYPLETSKDAFHQIAKFNEFHSLQERVQSVVWGGVDRYEDGAKAFGLKITGEGEENHFTVKAFRHHLIASMARLFYSGVWYDLVLCVFGSQGSGKTTGLRIVYARQQHQLQFLRA